METKLFYLNAKNFLELIFFFCYCELFKLTFKIIIENIPQNKIYILWMHAQVTYNLLVHFMEPVSKKNLLNQKQIIGFWKKKNTLLA